MSNLESNGKQIQIFLKDYQKPQFEILKTELWFELSEEKTIVRSQLQMQRSGPASTKLILHGEDLQLKKLFIDQLPLTSSSYSVDKHALTIFTTPANFELEMEVEINPSTNTTLSGLYLSHGLLTTQCEAEGFRRITFYLDRPDVMAPFVVHMNADEKKFPILLSNGNRLASKNLGNGRHEVTFEDPFKKASYLFALVAGDLAVLQDSFRTMTGREVHMEIYADSKVIERCHHAMESLKRAFRWDEIRFGREYDLSTFMIVAISDFNSGAMENKGLNIFNSRLILAEPKSATDLDYFLIESVIAHEYFHNWTGNRVTLRDWFHLSLKEGLTVFRDQEFSMDLHSASAVRIDSVEELRNRQFAEDAGPNAHPIRPESCYAVDNFYTSTIYEKGAEVIRMMQTLVGRPGFRKGMDLYFARHDGQAVIIEDFAKAIADANSIDLDQFRLWYSQAGTPIVKIVERYDAANRSFTLLFEQSCPKTFKENEKIGFEKKPFHIPLEIALFDPRAGEISFKHSDIRQNSEQKNIFELKTAEASVVFSNVPVRPVLSINRNFSAPVKIEQQCSLEDYLTLLEKEPDAFSQWEASQKIYEKFLLNQIPGTADDHGIALQKLGAILSAMMRNPQTDLSVLTKILSFPADIWLAQNDTSFEADRYLTARKNLKKYLAVLLQSEFSELVARNTAVPVEWNQETMSRRSLKNLALDYLSAIDGLANLSWQHYERANLMTDEQACYETLVEIDEYRDRAINRFYQNWENEPIVLNKWFSIQAMASHPATFETVRKLWSHSDFDVKNPNRVYSLLLRFGSNLTQFHGDQTATPTYAWALERILEVDRLNPQVAARVSSIFNFCAKTNAASKAEASRLLGEVLKQKLSPNTFEILNNAYRDLMC